MSLPPPCKFFFISFALPFLLQTCHSKVCFVVQISPALLSVHTISLLLPFCLLSDNLSRDLIQCTSSLGLTFLALDEYCILNVSNVL